MRVGAVVRDSSGEVLAAVSTIIPYIIDSDVAEVITAWKAMTFCCEMGFQQVIFERDPVSVVTTM
jgi:hypothetical protein